MTNDEKLSHVGQKIHPRADDAGVLIQMSLQDETIPAACGRGCLLPLPFLKGEGRGEGSQCDVGLVSSWKQNRIRRV